jgi:hypothetical protein
MSDPPPDERPGRHHSDNPTAEEIHRVAAALDAYTTRHEAAEAKTTKHNRKVRRWSRGATVVALVYTVVTTGVLIASIRSIQETRRATHYASKAASAATRQADISADTEQRQLRAYLGFGVASIQCAECKRILSILRTNPTAVDLPINIAPSIDNQIIGVVKNFGITPAYNAEFHISFEILPPYQTLPDSFLYPDKPKVSLINVLDYRSGALVGANDKVQVSDYPTAEALVGIVMAGIGRATVYAYGHVDYDDIFLVRHHRLYTLLYNASTGTFAEYGDRGGSPD